MQPDDKHKESQGRDQSTDEQGPKDETFGERVRGMSGRLLAGAAAVIAVLLVVIFAQMAGGEDPSAAAQSPPSQERSADGQPGHPGQERPDGDGRGEDGPDGDRPGEDSPRGDGDGCESRQPDSGKEYQQPQSGDLGAAMSGQS